jgi:excisionase family DNA binding protein
MSSLKDWYRYVDSRARTRPGSGAPPERERPTDESEAGQAPAGASAGERSVSPSSPGADEPVVAGEEGLDVWAGLFPQQRKPEPRPTTAPLKRPAARLDELPPDLPFARTPIDSPPAPQFPLPAGEVPIPSFDEFVSPFTPEPPAAAPAPGPAAVTGASPVQEVDSPPPPAVERPAAVPTGEPSTAAAAGSSSPRPPAGPEGRAPRAETPAGSGAAASAPTPAEPPPVLRKDPPALDATLQAGFGTIPSPSAASGPVSPGQAAPPADPGSGPSASMAAEPPSDTAGSASAPTASPSSPAASDDETRATDDWRLATEEGQVRWHSPFELPGPGRTVSSGAPSPRPEPIVPRAISPQPAAENPEPEATLSNAAPRPAPGTEAWERERVERLARTFRETLRVLEQSLAVPRSQASRGTEGEGRPIDEEPAADTGQREALGADQSTAAPALAFTDLAEPPVAPPASRPTGLVTVPAPDSMPEPAGLAAPPAAPPVPPMEPEAAPVEAEPSPVEGPSAPDLTLSASPDAPVPASTAAVAEAPADLESEICPEAASPVSAQIPGVPEPRAAPAAPDHRAAVAPPPRSVSSATPDVLRNIEEAALIRQRLPQHMAMMLRIPTNEVAQHSYKSPFRESREELIGRLLDPQLTLEEAARILGVCPTTVRRYTNRGMLQCHRTPGNQRRFRMSDVLQFLEQYGDRIDRAAEAPQFEEAA